MLRTRRVLHVLAGMWVSASIVAIALHQILGLRGDGVRVTVLVFAALGGVGGLLTVDEVKPMPGAERRDTILGWGSLVGGVAAIACLWLPWPWNLPAAAAVLAATIVLLRRVT